MAAKVFKNASIEAGALSVKAMEARARLFSAIDEWESVAKKQSARMDRIDRGECLT